MKIIKGDLILKKSMVFKDSINVEGNIICKNVRFNLTVAGNIWAWNISAGNIDAGDISAGNIDAMNINALNIIAGDINAGNISYYAVCFAYNNITCKSIEGRREHCKHFVLDGKIKEEEK
jgi:predicted acyltransferase (DUF342 family)